MDNTEQITIPLYKQQFSAQLDEVDCIYPKNLTRKQTLIDVNRNPTKKINSKYHTQLFVDDNTISCHIVPSTMYIKNNSDSLLKINLASPIFDVDFDKKEISKITLKNNSNNSVDLFIHFKK